MTAVKRITFVTEDSGTPNKPGCCSKKKGNFEVFDDTFLISDRLTKMLAEKKDPASFVLTYGQFVSRIQSCEAVIKKMAQGTDRVELTGRVTKWKQQAEHLENFIKGRIDEEKRYKVFVKV